MKSTGDALFMVGVMLGSIGFGELSDRYYVLWFSSMYTSRKEAESSDHKIVYFGIHLHIQLTDFLVCTVCLELFF